MSTYREIEEEIAGLEKAIKTLQRKINSDRDILFDYDEESEWVTEKLREEQARFHVYCNEYWTIEYFLRALADKEPKRLELDMMAANLAVPNPESPNLYKLIPERYADQAALYRGGGEANGEAAGSARTSPHEPVYKTPST